jgi:hypothetical protein
MGLRRRRLAVASREQRANRAADSKDNENAAPQQMARCEKHDADHDKRHGDGEQDQGERADAADISDVPPM